MGGEKEEGKEEKNNRRRTDKAGEGGSERRARIHFTHAVTYISTSTPIIQYGLTPLVLTVHYNSKLLMESQSSVSHDYHMTQL